uniref:Uncharacterized protein n=1 Tax=Arundo donax TaxID=35708 RepID=A0A0A8Z2V0_ARUDO
MQTWPVAMVMMIRRT